MRHESPGRASRVADESGIALLIVLLVVTLLTVTVTGALVVVKLEVSRATAVRVCEPFGAPAVFQGTEYGEEPVTSLPRFAPSSLNCTPANATLSLAVAVTVTVPLSVELPAGATRDTVGGVVSLLTATLMPTLTVVRFDVSRATAVSVCGPLATPLVFQAAAASGWRSCGIRSAIRGFRPGCARRRSRSRTGRKAGRAPRSTS